MHELHVHVHVATSIIIRTVFEIMTDTSHIVIIYIKCDENPLHLDQII